MRSETYSAAILIDAGYLLFRLWSQLGGRHAKAADVIGFAHAAMKRDERLFRVYLYDCPPLEGRSTNPVSGVSVNFASTATCQRRKSLHDRLSKSDHIAFRQGVLQFTGWKISSKRIQDIQGRGGVLRPEDVTPEIRQKRTDMKIGLDVAWLATKGIVDRIILVTADTDFVPAMKFARREGVQVVVAAPERGVHQDMLKHTDEFRVVTYPEQRRPAGG
jgi:uncharacterized LabA/DUF88 family protein